MVKVLAAAVALVMTTGTTFAVMGKTNTDVALRTAPAAQAGVILNLPEGAIVNVGRCSSGWCGVTFNKHGGYVRESALQFQSTPISGPPAIPVYPPYPYKAGHYPTADAYYDLPPYAAINPSFYRWRFFLMAQERNRYRYMPHIFRGYTGYREDTVGSYVSSSELVSKPMSPKSPTKAEPSPTGPSGVSEPNAKKEDAGSSIEPSPPGSTSPRASSKKSELTPAPQPLKSGSAVVAVTPTAPIPSALPVHVAQDPILARVNDTEIKQSDLDSTASDLGSRLAALPPEHRYLTLLRVTIDNQLMAEAAENQKLAAGLSFEGWTAYQRRRTLRDMYFDKDIRGLVSDQAINKLHDEKISQIERESEVRFREILVPTEAEAEKVAERLKNGEDFVAIAKEVSKDSSSERGAALGFVRRGELIAPVEDAVFALKVGEISKPIQTQLGWNIFKLEEKRQQPLPTWDSLKDELAQQKVREVVSQLRRAAKIEIFSVEQRAPAQEQHIEKEAPAQ